MKHYFGSPIVDCLRFEGGLAAERGELVLERLGRSAILRGADDKLINLGDTELLGWGSLDGQCVRLGLDGWSGYYAVPLAQWTEVEAWLQRKAA